MTAFYNEIDPYAAQWLRNLIAAGHIALGVVDERSIEDIKPEELYGYTQCHFFAGVGVWSLALRHAGWPDDRPIWTGSCPCQPFSAAGQGAGFADERHLWPAFHHLIAECRPPIVLGEQVASSNVDPWIDLVHADLEAVDYSFGGVPFPSAGVGAPHIRDRLYWVANANMPGQRSGGRGGLHRKGEAGTLLALGSDPGGLGDAGREGLDQRECECGVLGGTCGACPGQAVVGAGIYVGGVANADGIGRPGDEGTQPGIREGANQPSADRSGTLRPGPTNGYWRDADWLGCRDGKWRPVEPGTSPLAHGAASRVGRLRAYGNAINAEAARVFIEAVMESI